MKNGRNATPMRRRRIGSSRPLLGLVAGAAGIVMLAACSSNVSSNADNQSGNTGGPSVPYGASAEEWQEAFAEVDGEFDLVWQLAGSAATDQGVRTQQQVDRIEEYSDGKISIELVFNDAVSGATGQATEAMQDGRIDLHMFASQLHPSDFPVSGKMQNESTIIRGPGYISGNLAAFGALNEAWWGQEALHEEYSDIGLTVMNPLPAQPYSYLACREPVSTLEDLQGKQIRVGPSAAFGQIEALGATPVSVPFADLFESVQRGIVDCLLIGSGTMKMFPGMTELVPYIAHPTETSFVSTTAIDLAGASWSDLPLVAQQLIYDAQGDYLLEYQGGEIQDGLALAEAVSSAGGEITQLDEAVNDRLIEHNEGLIESMRSSDLLDDGDAFVGTLMETSEKWQGLIEEAGITDAELSDVDAWSNADVSWDAFEDLYMEHVHLPNRPE